MSIRLNYAEMIASSFTLSTLLVNPKSLKVKDKLRLKLKQKYLAFFMRFKPSDHVLEM